MFIPAELCNASREDLDSLYSLKRMGAGALMAVDVGLFGTFAGFIASWFVEERRHEEEVVS